MLFLRIGTASKCAFSISTTRTTGSFLTNTQVHPFSALSKPFISSRISTTNLLSKNMSNSAVKSDAEWRAVLSPEQVCDIPFIQYFSVANHLDLADPQFRILRQKGTEAGGTGEYNKHTAPGVYACAGCGTPLYKSTTKFDVCIEEYLICMVCGLTGPLPPYRAVVDGLHSSMVGICTCHEIEALGANSSLSCHSSHPRSRIATRRQFMGHEAHRNHLYCVRWTPRTCLQRRRVSNP